jgi:hypothetical protein
MAFQIPGTNTSYTPPPHWSAQATKMGNMTMDDLGKFLIGKDPATQRMIRKGLAETADVIPGLNAAKVARFAGTNPVAKNILRAVPLIGTGMFVGDVANVVAGPDSFGNKAMDATAMGIGGAIGMIGGPLGAMAGASTGKAISDVTQYVFGGGKSAEQRKMEQALAMLNRGVG